MVAIQVRHPAQALALSRSATRTPHGSQQPLALRSRTEGMTTAQAFESGGLSSRRLAENGPRTSSVRR